MESVLNLPVNPSPKLAVVDAMNIFYRAFHAVPGLSRSDGFPTNALFGFIKSMDQFRKKWTPTHMVVVLEGGIPAKRLELLADYKAQRPPMPDALRDQLPALEEYLDAAAIARVRVEAEEADDVMASIALAAKNEAEILILSGDKDMLQIVGGKVVVVSPADPAREIGPDQVLEKTGVRPDQIPAWLALTGDSADNIDGVPGVGKKTAAKWLAEHGSLDEIFAHIEQLKPARLATALAEHRETVFRNLELVTLRCDPDSFPDWRSAFVAGNERPETLLSFFDKYEFHSMANPLRERSLF